MGGCCGEGIPSCERVFDRQTADRDVRDYRRKGAPWATRELIDELAAGVDLGGATVLDVGAGVGTVHLGLLARGAASAVDVDGSGAYVAAARDEAERAGYGDRVRHVVGDLTLVLRRRSKLADLVALDRVVCCYGDMASLLTAASSVGAPAARPGLPARPLVDPGRGVDRQRRHVPPFGRVPDARPPGDGDGGAPGGGRLRARRRVATAVFGGSRPGSAYARCPWRRRCRPPRGTIVLPR